MADASTAAPPAQAAPSPPPRLRVGRATRLWHWVNAIALLVLLMSGLTIFNAHPRLYWGEAGNRFDPAWLAVASGETIGKLRIGSLEIETTGVLGNWQDAQGRTQRWAFPGWATIPSRYDLAAGRRWHFFFAWVLALNLTAFMITSLATGHVARDLHMRKRDWSPRGMWQHARDHARLRFHTEAGAIYNPLQKLSYIGVIFVALPLMIATGLAMAPGMDAALPWLVNAFGGRHSARSIHFIIAFALVGFFLVHIALVLIHRPFYLLRAITIGAQRDEPEGKNP